MGVRRPRRPRASRRECTSSRRAREEYRGVFRSPCFRDTDASRNRRCWSSKQNNDTVRIQKQITNKSYIYIYTYTTKKIQMQIYNVIKDTLKYTTKNNVYCILEYIITNLEKLRTDNTLNTLPNQNTNPEQNATN